MNDKPIYTPTMWRDDLLSGEFRRAAGMLVNGDGMCCLGVGSFRCGMSIQVMSGAQPYPQLGWFPLWDGLPDLVDVVDLNDLNERVDGRWQPAEENPKGVVAYIENHLIGRIPAGMFAEVAS